MSFNPHINLQLARLREREFAQPATEPGPIDRSAAASGVLRGRGMVAMALLLLVAAVGLLSGPAFAASTAGYPKQAKFWVSITAHQHIKWDITPPPLDCKYATTSYEKGAGTEDITFTTKPVKAVVVQWVRGNPIVFRWNTWDPYGLTKAVTTGLIAKATLNRDGYYEDACQMLTPFYDCGDRHANYGIQLRDVSGKLELEALATGDQPSDSKRWVNCPVRSPAAITPGAFTTINSTLPASELFDRAIGKEIVLGKKPFVLKKAGPMAPAATADVRWTVTLTRVK